MAAAATDQKEEIEEGSRLRIGRVRVEVVLKKMTVEAKAPHEQDFLMGKFHTFPIGKFFFEVDSPCC